MFEGSLASYHCSSPVPEGSTHLQPKGRTALYSVQAWAYMATLSDRCCNIRTQSQQLPREQKHREPFLVFPGRNCWRRPVAPSNVTFLSNFASFFRLLCRFARLLQNGGGGVNGGGGGVYQHISNRGKTTRALGNRRERRQGSRLTEESLGGLYCEWTRKVKYSHFLRVFFFFFPLHITNEHFDNECRQ